MPSTPALLLVSEMYPPAIGGSAVLFENIYSRLQNDLDITVLTDRTKCTGEETQRGRIKMVRTDMRKWLRGVVSGQDRKQHWAVARMIRQLTKPRPTLVHCGRSAPEGISALFCRRLLLGPRYLCWAHGEEITTARMSREYKFVMARVYRGAAGILANSVHTANMVASFGVPMKRIHVVHPGVNIERFNTNLDGADLRKKYVPDGSLMLLTVGRLPPRKGHDLVIRAMAKLRGHQPKLHYVIAGDGERDERPRLERLVAECGVGDSVTFTGNVNEADLPRMFAACDVFLMPNRIENGDVEGFGIVYLEAAACGKPTIGGKSGGVPEAVEDGKTGLLVSGNDVDELAAAITQLADSPQTRTEMGVAGRRRVVEQFTWDRAAAMVRDVHQRLSSRQ